MPLLHRTGILIALAALLALLAGCGALVDGSQVRICRMTLPAIAPTDAAITVLRVAPAEAPYTLRIDYRVGGADGTGHFVECGFPDEGLDLVRGRLAALRTEAGPFSPVQLHILNHFWLEKTATAIAADPGPGLSVTPPLLVSQPMAYFIQALANALPPTAVTMLIAVSYALIYGLIGRINLAFGEFAALGAYGTVIGAVLASQAGIGSVAAGLLVAAVFGLGVAAIHGFVVERVVFTPLAFGRGQSILVATLALAIVLQEYMRITQGTQVRWLPPIWSLPLPLAGSGSFVASVTLMQLICGGLALALALALVFGMRHSQFGYRWRAMADDAVMAGLLGLSPRAILGQSFVLASLLAGTAGFLTTAYYGGAGYASGTMMGLKGLVAAVVGGIGSIEGALLGGLCIGVFEALWSAYLPVEQRDLAVISLLAVVLVLRPGGLLGVPPKD